MNNPLENASKKWGEYALNREAGKEVSRLFAMHHPVVREFIHSNYLDGSAPWDLLKIFMVKLPCVQAMEIGCGIGNLARGMITGGVCLSVDAVDLSPDVIAVAERADLKQGITSIRYCVQDANEIKLKPDHYDLIYQSQSVHHIENLENLFQQINTGLKEDGLYYFNDYVGPSRMQWTDQQLKIVNNILRQWPDRLVCHSRHDFKPQRRVARVPVKQYLKIDPTEGVRSAEILSVAEKFLDIEAIYPLGGTISYELLRGRIHNFDENNQEDVQILLDVLEYEKQLIDSGEIDSDFALCYARKKIH